MQGGSELFEIRMKDDARGVTVAFSLFVFVQGKLGLHITISLTDHAHHLHLHWCFDLTIVRQN